MTLLIALMLMNHFGTGWWTYPLVFIVWCLHIGYHSPKRWRS